MSSTESACGFRQEALEARKRRVYGEVVLRQFFPGWMLGVTFAGLLLLGLVALAFGSYARTEMVRGMLIPGTGAAKVLPHRTGVVARVFVREGQLVGAGAPLALIRVDRSLPSGADQQQLQQNILREQQRIIAAQMEHAMQELRREEASAATRLIGLRGALQNTREQLRLGVEIAASARGQFDILNDLDARRLVRRSELEEQRRAYLNAESQQRGLRTEIERITSEIRELELERGRLGERSREIVRRLELSRNEAELRLVGVRGESTFLLKAPIAGRVTGLQAAPGQAVTPARPLSTILPAGADLRAHLFVPSRSAGFLRVGQPVRVRYDAFPYQQFGAFEGRIAEVSQNVFHPSELAVPISLDGPVYRVVVTLRDQTVRAYGEDVSLTPGLTLSSSIVLERRSLLDVLLDPVRAVRARN